MCGRAPYALIHQKQQKIISIHLTSRHRDILCPASFHSIPFISDDDDDKDKQQRRQRKAAMKLKLRRRTASVVVASSICIILVTGQFSLGGVPVAAFSPTGTDATTTVLERNRQRTVFPPAVVICDTTLHGRTRAASRSSSSSSSSTLHSSSSSSSSRSTAAVPETSDRILEQALLERQQRRKNRHHSQQRTIRVERYARLPVWPVWAGVIDFFVGWIFGPEVGSRLEQYVLGGRVCPMQFDTTTSSPFILLVHQ